MLGNLMDNACNWARSQVLVRAECADDRLLVVVEDDGPGIPEPRRFSMALPGRVFIRGLLTDWLPAMQVESMRMSSIASAAISGSRSADCLGGGY